MLPALACLTNSCLTDSSDRCIAVARKQADDKHTVRRASTQEENVAILQHAAKRILEAPDDRTRYAIAEVAAPVVASMSFMRDSTPALVLELAASFAPAPGSNAQRRI